MTSLESFGGSPTACFIFDDVTFFPNSSELGLVCSFPPLCSSTFVYTDCRNFARNLLWKKSQNLIAQDVPKHYMVAPLKIQQLSRPYDIGKRHYFPNYSSSALLVPSGSRETCNNNSNINNNMWRFFRAC